MDLPTYGQPQRITVGGLIKTGRLKPLPEPPIGRHSADRVDHPDAITVTELTGRVADPQVIAWWDAQQSADTRRIERVALPALGGAA